jgi:hypothetical protein
MVYVYPLATVIECIRGKSVIYTKIHLDRISNPIAPATLRIDDLPYKNGTTKIFRLHRLVTRKDDILEFETFEEFEPQSSLVAIGYSYHYIGWWIPDGLALAQSNPDDLQRYLFSPKTDGDHDHCELCWKTISDYIEYDHEAYTDGHNSICIECYDKYVRSGFGKLLGDTA